MKSYWRPALNNLMKRKAQEPNPSWSVRDAPSEKRMSKKMQKIKKDAEMKNSI